MKSKPIVIWNGFDGSLETLCPNIKIAAEILQVSVNTLKQYVDSGKKYNRKYVSHYYTDDVDNKKTNIIFPIQQLRNNQIVNQFRTLLEAAEHTGLTRYKISDLCNSGDLDCWNCTWKNLKKLV